MQVRHWGTVSHADRARLANTTQHNTTPALSPRTPRTAKDAKKDQQGALTPNAFTSLGVLGHQSSASRDKSRSGGQDQVFQQPPRCSAASRRRVRAALRELPWAGAVRRHRRPCRAVQRCSWRDRFQRTEWSWTPSSERVDESTALPFIVALVAGIRLAAGSSRGSPFISLDATNTDGPSYQSGSKSRQGATAHGGVEKARVAGALQRRRPLVRDIEQVPCGTRRCEWIPAVRIRTRIQVVAVSSHRKADQCSKARHLRCARLRSHARSLS